MTTRPDMVGNQFAKGNKPNQTSFRKGQVAWNKGKKWSAKTRKKQSEARKRFHARGGIHPLLGKKRPDMAGQGNPNWEKFGPAHPKWTDDKKRPFYKSIRQIFKYVEWRNAVFARDDFACVLCNARGVFLEADHFPRRFVDIVRDNSIEDIAGAMICDELWDVSNGRTLCQPCHRQTPTWGRRMDSEEKQKWLKC